MVTEKPLAYTINTVHDVAPWGRSRTYELVREGKLPAKKLGASTYILREDLVRFLHDLDPAGPAQATLPVTSSSPTEAEHGSFAGLASAVTGGVQ